VEPKPTCYTDGISRLKLKMTDIGYILENEGIVKQSGSLIQHDGAAAFKLSDR